MYNEVQPETKNTRCHELAEEGEIGDVRAVLLMIACLQSQQQNNAKIALPLAR